MINKKTIENYIKENKIHLQKSTTGMILDASEKEITITGDQISLLELADTIVSVALSNNEQDHVHLDDLTIINSNSKIKEIIIEKR